MSREDVREFRICVSVNHDLWTCTESSLAQVTDEGTARVDELSRRALEIHDTRMRASTILTVREVPGYSNVLLSNEPDGYTVAYRAVQELADLLRGHVPLAFLEPVDRVCLSYRVTLESQSEQQDSPFRHGWDIVRMTVYKFREPLDE